MLGINPPKTSPRLIPVVNDAEMAALIKNAEKVRAPKYASKRAQKAYVFEARRDTAIFRFLASSGCRLAEILVDLDARCAVALDRYLRVRATHQYADSPELWLG